MSYLELPRLHFSGRFQTDPSTINNYAHNYSLDYVVEDPGSQWLKWNPNGSHAWSFHDCRVTRVSYADGSSTSDPAEDPVIGAAFLGTAGDYPAKITSLDVENQITYEVWGFDKVGVDGGAGGFTGNCRVTQGAEGWQRVPMPDQLQTNNPYTTARFLSLLDPVKWLEPLRSRFLRELRERSGDRLAINYVCDGYSEDPYAPDGLAGRVVGTVGPYRPGEPVHFVGGRLLRPTNFDADNAFLGSPFFFAPFQVESGRRVSVDLGNSIPTTIIGGPPPDFGDLRLVIRRPRVQLGNPLHADDDLGSLRYLPEHGGGSAVYLETAFVQDFAWKDGVDDTPLALVSVKHGKIAYVYLEEDADGRYLIAEIPPQKLGDPAEYMGEGIAIRMNPDDVVRVNVRAYAFGRPASGVGVDLYQSVAFLDDIAGDQGKIGTPDTPPVGVPEDALVIVSCDKEGDRHGRAIYRIETGGNGQAEFCLRADNPLVDGKPPRYDGRLDGQVYTVQYNWASGGAMPADPWNVLSVKIFNSFRLANTPSWNDVLPILAQYAKMYPYMRNVVDLMSYEAVSVPRTAQLLKTVLSFPIDHSNYMPVTRDLSRDKRDMILEWIDLGMPVE